MTFDVMPRTATHGIFKQSASVLALVAFLGFGAEPAMSDELLGRHVVGFSLGRAYGDSQPWAEAFGTSDPLPEIRPTEALEFSYGMVRSSEGIAPWLGSDWNVGIFARVGHGRSSDGGLASPYYNILGGGFSTFYTQGNVKHSETHAIVDFEARRDVGFGQGAGFASTLRVGARFAYLGADTDTEFVYLPIPAYTLTEDRRTSFAGIGPRVALDMIKPMNNGVNLELGVGAAAIFGESRTRVNTTGGLIGVSGSVSESDFKVVPMLDVRAAVSFPMESLSKGGRLSVGVLGEAWLNVYDTRNTVSVLSNSYGNKNADRTNARLFFEFSFPM